MMTSYIILKGWHLFLILLAPSITKLIDKLVYLIWDLYIKPKHQDKANEVYNRGIKRIEDQLKTP